MALVPLTGSVTDVLWFADATLESFAEWYVSLLQFMVQVPREIFSFFYSTTSMLLRQFVLGSALLAFVTALPSFVLHELAPAFLSSSLQWVLDFTPLGKYTNAKSFLGIFLPENRYLALLIVQSIGFVVDNTLQPVSYAYMGVEKVITALIGLPLKAVSNAGAVAVERVNKSLGWKGKALVLSSLYASALLMWSSSPVLVQQLSSAISPDILLTLRTNALMLMFSGDNVFLTQFIAIVQHVFANMKFEQKFEQFVAYMTVFNNLVFGKPVESVQAILNKLNVVSSSPPPPPQSTPKTTIEFVSNVLNSSTPLDTLGKQVGGNDEQQLWFVRAYNVIAHMLTSVYAFVRPSLAAIVLNTLSYTLLSNKTPDELDEWAVNFERHIQLPALILSGLGEQTREQYLLDWRDSFANLSASHTRYITLARLYTETDLKNCWSRVAALPLGNKLVVLFRVLTSFVQAFLGDMYTPLAVLFAIYAAMSLLTSTLVTSYRGGGGGRGRSGVDTVESDEDRAVAREMHQLKNDFEFVKQWFEKVMAEKQGDRSRIVDYALHTNVSMEVVKTFKTRVLGTSTVHQRIDLLTSLVKDMFKIVAELEQKLGHVYFAKAMCTTIMGELDNMYIVLQPYQK